MRTNSYIELKSGQRAKIDLGDKPDAYLAYDIEQFGFAPARGVLVWVFPAGRMDDRPGCLVGVDSVSGEVIQPFCTITD